MKTKWLLLSLFISRLVVAQSGTEIYLLDIQFKNNQLNLSHGKNISNHPGYDSQPFFHRSQPVIYYASFNDSGRSEIKMYNYQNDITRNLTFTNEREYSPTLTPDGKFISCIIQRDNGAQDLGKYPVEGGEPIILIDKLTVGYHAWIDNNSLLLFVLDDTVSNSLHYYNLLTKEDKVLVKNPGRSLHKIPGKEALSFIEKKSDNEWLIREFDVKTQSVTTITTTLPKREDLCWLNDGTILMSDGTKLYSFNAKKEKDWIEIAMPATISTKGISRLAVNKANDKLAIVMAE